MLSIELSSEAIEILEESNACSSAESTKASIAKILHVVKRYQDKVRKHIESNYVDFIPNHTSADLFIDEGETLMREVDDLRESISTDATTKLREASDRLQEFKEQLQESSLGLKTSCRILKIDDTFQCLDKDIGDKDYLAALDLLGQLQTLIYDNKDNMLQKCECYNTIVDKYHVQTLLLQDSLQQRFEYLVQLNEKHFSNAKSVTIQVSKDENQLQNTVMALFQARYNPTKTWNFLLHNCLEPLITKPVSIELLDDHAEYHRLTLSYSAKDLSTNIRPGYKQVFTNLKSVLDSLKSINVPVTETKYVFTIFGEHIKERLLRKLVDDCLMNFIPETMDELKESTLLDDIQQFEQFLSEVCLIDIQTERTLAEFCEQFPVHYRKRFSKKIEEAAKVLMAKDLQDVKLVADINAPDAVARIPHPEFFPRCMISKSVPELIKLMETYLAQMKVMSSKGEEEHNPAEDVALIPSLYVSEIPKVHGRLLESIPQQSAVFYNNCMFLALWVVKNAKRNCSTTPTLVKALQSEGTKYFEQQVSYQQKIIASILKEFDLSTAVQQTLGVTPPKLIRQCLRQLDLLRNVWANVLPEHKYSAVMGQLLHGLCSEIIKRIIAMEDIPTTVATELSECIDIILEKAPTLFKEKHQVVLVSSWMKLEQLKMILNASLQEITEQWCEGAGILTANYKAEEVKHLIRALFQNTDRRSKALAKVM